MGCGEPPSHFVGGAGDHLCWIQPSSSRWQLQRCPRGDDPPRERRQDQRHHRLALQVAVPSPCCPLLWLDTATTGTHPASPLPKAMAPRGSLLLLLALLLLVTHCPGQHWSHGWFPGGKRDLGTPPARPAWGPRLVPARGRKTRHDPPAKSKASRLKVPPPVDPEELLVVIERYRQHRLVLGALRAEFRAEVLQKRREALMAQDGSADLMEEHQRLMAWNEEENARQRARREERLRKEEEEQKRHKLQAAETRARKMEAVLKEKEKEVLQLQEEAKSFITPENLEARIEECLDNPRNYNFAIDKEGRIVRRTVLP
ncbi:small ribosomal subunit protein mS26 [Pogoniulus pusillus]|uniref:small ribosomal subunit protein mS26 n=1 Tax=Pogoniulus pusillus TaxID=488313 RepID=UPI0030B98F3F